jgi:CheY-like chemotaxis protein/nitrogen-specific signal transduction histidine kinase
MARALRLLVVEDSEDDHEILIMEVRRGGYDVTSTCVRDAEELGRALGEPWDLMTTDWLMPGFGGRQALQILADRQLDLPCIVISGTPNEEAAVEALRAGALDFLSKDKPLRFVPAIERALREAAERRQVDTIRSRAIELELQNRRIQEANRLKSEFLANMSHELRTPLNAIIGFAELLHDGHVPADSPQHKEFLGDILTSGRHLLQLINDVLDLAKVEAGKLDFRPEPFEVRRPIEEVVAITRTAAGAKRITVEVDIDPSVGTVTLDPARLKQVVYNYLSNALKFTPERGRVAVRVRPDGEHAFRLEVEDTGMGIEATDLGRLFVEFQQLDGSAGKRHQGTGLGLALTRRLVEAQHGSVGVRSEPGKGSVFHAILPRVTTAGEAPVLPRSRNGRSGGRCVLVVEDEPRDREVIVGALAAAGYAVEVAPSAAAAIERCRERTFDAVTLDLVLPDMGGFDLLHALRAEPHMRDVPVIVVSVVADAKLVAGFAVSDVLRKPLDPPALLAALQRAGVQPERRGGVLVVDDDPGALRLMDAVLEQLGFGAITRSSAVAGLEAAEHLVPSAVVLDLMMPEMDGIEFLDRFRRLPAHARTPVLIWTMKELTATEHEQLRHTAQAIVSKNGGSPSTVIAQLRTLLPEVGGLRILIVDDNPTNLKLVAYLVKANGYEVETAGDAEQAMAVLQTHRPALILMDLQLPGIDGLELTRRLKADPATRAIKIIAVTAYAMKGDQEKAIEAGCDAYVTKPIDTRALPALIAEQLGLPT